MRECAEDGSLRLGILSLEGQPIASQFWVVCCGTACVLKLAHDEGRRALSPGTVLTAWMIRRLLEEDQVSSLDFGRGDDDYKKDWVGARRQRIGCCWPIHVKWQGPQPSYAMSPAGRGGVCR